MAPLALRESTGSKGPTGSGGPTGATGATGPLGQIPYGYFYTVGAVAAIGNGSNIPFVQFAASGGISYSGSTVTLGPTGVYQVSFGYAWDPNNSSPTHSANFVIFVNGSALTPAGSGALLTVTDFSMVSASVILVVTTPNTTLSITNQSGGIAALYPAFNTPFSSYLMILKLN